MTTTVPSGGGGAGAPEIDYDVRNITIREIRIDKMTVTTTVEQKGWRDLAETIVKQRIVKTDTDEVIAEISETLVIPAGLSEIRSTLIPTEHFTTGNYRYEITLAYRKNTKFSASASLLFKYWGEVPVEFQQYPPYQPLPAFKITTEMALAFLSIAIILAFIIAYKVKR